MLLGAEEDVAIRVSSGMSIAVLSYSNSATDLTCPLLAQPLRRAKAVDAPEGASTVK
jgi:hypothetical protein